MEVYRLCKEAEINSILIEENFKNVGNKFNIDNEKNNHQYRNDKNYLHFFKEKSSLLYLDNSKGNFICVYDIPKNILNASIGVGYYYDFYNFRNLEHVVEYAVESETIKFEYLKDVYMIKKWFDVDEYLEDENLSKFLTRIYKNNNIEHLENEAMLKLENTLTKDDVIESINKNLEFLLNIIPEIKDMMGFEHKHPHHHLDVWNHTLLALSLSENIFEIRLALLLHDIGKPHCFTEGEVRHFKGHPEVSSKMGKDILLRIGYEEDFIDEVCYLIETHDTIMTREEIENNFEVSYKRFLIQRCDALAHNPQKLEKRKNYITETKKVLTKSLKELIQ